MQSQSLTKTENLKCFQISPIIYAGQIGVEFRGWAIWCFLLSPIPWRSTKAADYPPLTPSLPGESSFAFWNYSLAARLQTMSEATCLSQHHIPDFCPSLAVQKVWQTCSGNTLHKGSFEQGEVQCPFFSPFIMISSELYSITMHFLYYYFWKGQLIKFV